MTQAFNGLGRDRSARSTPSSSRRASRPSPTRSRTPRRTCAAPPPGCPRCPGRSPAGTRSSPELLSGTPADHRTARRRRTASFADADLRDGNLLLGEIQRRRDAIHALLTGTQNLGTQLTGLVADNSRQLAPTLDALDRVTGVLQRNQANLDQALALAGPYYRLVGNTLGNGRWFDSYLCGLVPKSYLPAGTPPETGCMPPNAGRPGEP